VKWIRTEPIDGVSTPHVPRWQMERDSRVEGRPGGDGGVGGSESFAYPLPDLGNVRAW